MIGGGVVITRWTRVRIVVCGVVLASLFLGVGKRAFTLQVRDADRLRGMAEEQYLREIELPPRRGRILDRNGAELASTADVDSIYCNPRQLPDSRDAARQLARVLGLERADLEKKLGQRRFFAWVKRKVTPDEVTAVKALGLPGIAFTHEPRRFYPEPHAGGDGHGPRGLGGSGLEGSSWRWTRACGGTSSSVQGMRDALGRDIALEGSGEARPASARQRRGADDRSLPDVHHRARAGGGRGASTTPRRAVAIMMDPRTGEVLAMASVPTYNPNDPQRRGRGRRAQPRHHRRVRARVDHEDVHDRGRARRGRGQARRPLRLFDGTDDGRQVHDPRHAPARRADRRGGVQVLEQHRRHQDRARLGRDQLAEALARFGFGQPTGIGLPGERAGIVRPVDKWGDIGFANVSFGQGLTVTPLQMVAGVCGDRRRRHLPRSRASSRASSRRTAASRRCPGAPERRVMAPAAARTMLAIMRGVTEQGGTAKQAAIDGYSVGGQDRHGAEGRQRALRSRQVGLVVRRRRAGRGSAAGASSIIMDEPQGGHLGGAVAAPIFKEIAEQSLRYLHVPPTTAIAAQGRGPSRRRKMRGGGGRRAVADGDEAASEAPRHRSAAGRRRAGRRSGAGRAVGRGRGRRGRAGRAGAAPSASSVPDFVGLSLGQAIHAARKSGVELAFDDPDGRATGVALRAAAGARPGTAGRGLPRGVRAQGMTALAFTLAALLRRHRRRARERRRGRIASSEVRDDSRQVEPGDLFVAVPGTEVDGRRFVADAVAARRRGAGRRRRAAGRARRSRARSRWSRARGGRWASSRATASAPAASADADRRDRHQRQDHDDVSRRGDAARGGRVAPAWSARSVPRRRAWRAARGRRRTPRRAR